MSRRRPSRKKPQTKKEKLLVGNVIVLSDVRKEGDFDRPDLDKTFTSLKIRVRADGKGTFNVSGNYFSGEKKCPEVSINRGRLDEIMWVCLEHLIKGMPAKEREKWAGVKTIWDMPAKEREKLRNEVSEAIIPQVARYLVRNKG